MWTTVPPPPLTPDLVGGAGAPSCDPALGQAWDPLTPQGECVLPSCCPAVCLVVWSGEDGEGPRGRASVTSSGAPPDPRAAGRPGQGRETGGQTREELPASGRAARGSCQTRVRGHSLSVCPRHLQGYADLLLRHTAALSARGFHREGGRGPLCTGFTSGLKQRWGRRAPPGSRAQETSPRREAQQRGDRSGDPDPGPWGPSLPHQPSPQDPASPHPCERPGRLSAVFQMGKPRLRTVRSRA